MLAGTEISAFVDALAHRGTMKPVQWFLQKYGVSYEEYTRLHYAALPAIGYCNIAGKYKHRLAVLSHKATEVAKYMRKVAAEYHNKDLDALIDMIYDAVQAANEPFESQIEEGTDYEEEAEA